MTVTNHMLYSGAIDWNEIYRQSYPLDDITNAVMAYLPKGNTDPILFSGFGEVAAKLANLYPIQYVEYSEYMANQVSLEYPEIDDVVHADILNHLFSSDASIACIICRISANWHSSDCIDRLLESITRYPRKLVLIDFFDDATFEGNKQIKIGTGPLQCDWIIDHQEHISGPIDMSISQLHGLYHSTQSIPNYSSDIASFRRQQITDYIQLRLRDYTVHTEEPLLPSDPSFLLLISPLTINE